MSYLTRVTQNQFEVGFNQKDQGILQDWLSDWNLFVDELHQHFGLLDPIGKMANMLDNLQIKLDNKISTYSMDFICYASQLGQKNSILYYCYYQSLPNQIQNPISTQEQGKLTLFQNIYTLVMTIDHCYQEHDHKHHHTRQVEKKALQSHSQKQGKAFTTSDSAASQNKTNISLVASSAKSSSSKSSSSPTPKKQLNSP